MVVSSGSAGSSFSRLFNATLGLVVAAVAIMLGMPSALAATYVGASQSASNVSPGGAAMYSIPITEPPGVAGIQPSLAFTYNSQSGDGLMGRGWTLSGLSAIARCPATMAQNGYRGNVNFDTNDRFCLDGQMLMAVTGSYGAVGTEYRTEIDQITKIVSVGTQGAGPSAFKAWTKSGQVLDFGSTLDSRIEGQGRADVSVLVWALNRVTDRKGNYMTVRYTEDTLTGEYFPTQIDYTGNGGVAPFHSVVFSFDTVRTIPSTSYVAGSKITRSRLLSAVHTREGTLAHMKEYRLAYKASTKTGEQWLQSVTECTWLANGTTADCLPATTFSFWDSGGNNWTGGNVSSTVCADGSTAGGVCNGADNYSYIQYPDINGDGKSDLCYRSDQGIKCNVSTGTGWGTYISTPYCANASTTDGICNDADNFTTIKFADFDGDGRADLAYRGDQGIRVYRSTGTGFTPLFLTSICANGSTANGICNDADNYNTIQYPDIDGDGRADICYRGDEGIKCYQGTGTGVGAYVSTTICSNSAATCDKTSMRFADFTGDGLMDFALRDTTGGVMIYEVNGAAFRNLTTTGMCATGSTAGNKCDSAENFSTLQYPDINGDGKADICYRGDLGIACLLFTGKGGGAFFGTDICATGSTLYGKCDGDNNYITIRFGDMNSDGKADLVFRADSGMQIFRSLGNGFTKAYSSIICADGSTSFGGCDGYGGASDNYGTITLADTNGDGYSDLCFRSNAGIQVHKGGGNNYLNGHMLTATNGLGASVRFEYKPLTDSLVYAKGTGAVYPSVEFQTPMYVVYQSVTSNGIGGSATTEYFYSGGRLDRNGRGFLGFASTRSTDKVTGVYTTTYYKQDFPFIGMPYQTWVASGSINVKLTANDYNAVVTGPGVRLPYASATTETSWDLITGAYVAATTTSRGVDVYGNLGYEAVSTNEGHYTETTTTYYPADTVNWLVSQAKRQTVKDYEPVSAKSAVRTKEFTYYSDGLLKEEIVEPDIAALRYKTTYVYTDDGRGNVKSTTVSGDTIATRTGSIAYDTKGRFPISTTNALNQTEGVVYDPHFGLVKSRTDANALTVSTEYDVFGRKKAEIRPDGTRTDWFYYNCGTCPTNGRYYIMEYSTGKPTKTVYYDNLGRELRTAVESMAAAATWVYKDTTYDTAGRVATVSRPYFAGTTAQKTTYSYDVLGRVKQELYPDGTKTLTDYQGLSTVATNPRGYKTTQVKNSRGQVTSVTDALNGKTLYYYAPFGYQLYVYDAKNNNVWWADYDAYGRLKYLATAESSRTMSYDALGQLKTEVNHKNQTTSYEYDLLGRLWRRSGPDHIATWGYDTGYKAIGKVSSATVSNGLTRYFYYDAYGRPSQVRMSGLTTTLDQIFAYDTSSRVSRITYPGTSLAINQIYDAKGYLSELRDYATNALVWKANTLAPDGRITQETYGNNLITTRAINAQTGQITGITTGVNATVQNLGYTYDANGNVKTRTDASVVGTTESFPTYDALDRLKTATVNGITRSYDYDEVGNIKTKSDVGTYAYGMTINGWWSPYALASTSGTVNSTFSYDSIGNMLTGNGKTVAYTSFNKPSSITANGTTSYFLYDENLQRVKKTSGTSTAYYFGGLSEQVITGTSTEYHQYIYAGNRLVAMAIEKPGTATPKTYQYVHLDRQGSIHKLTNQSGAIVGNYWFDAFGKRRQNTGADFTTWPTTTLGTRGYTGHEMDDESRLINMKAREYDPVIGRFLQPDPTVAYPGSTQGYNRFAYTDNNPLARIDPTGLGWWSDFRDKWLKPIAFTALAIYTGGLAYSAVLASSIAATAGVATTSLGTAVFAAQVGAATVQGMVAGAVMGGYSGYAQGGNLRSTLAGAMQGGAVGGLTGALGGAVRYSNLPGAMKLAGSGAVGGVQSAMQGGSFRDGFRFSLGANALQAGWEFTRQATDRLKVAACSSGGNACDWGRGSLRTDGARDVDWSGNPDKKGNWLTRSGMEFEGSGKHIYDAGNVLDSGYVRGFINDVSKVHDWFNSWNYNTTTGFYTSMGTAGDSAFQLYSFAGMPVAGALTFGSYAAELPYVPGVF